MVSKARQNPHAIHSRRSVGAASPLHPSSLMMAARSSSDTRRRRFGGCFGRWIRLTGFASSGARYSLMARVSTADSKFDSRLTVAALTCLSLTSRHSAKAAPSSAAAIGNAGASAFSLIVSHRAPPFSGDTSRAYRSNSAATVTLDGVRFICWAVSPLMIRASSAAAQASASSRVSHVLVRVYPRRRTIARHATPRCIMDAMRCPAPIRKR
jgi:hypothetical protein